MSMVRGKLEAIREISQQSLTVGDVFYIKRDEKWFDSSEPSLEVKVKILSLEDIANENTQPMSELRTQSQTGRPKS